MRDGVVLPIIAYERLKGFAEYFRHAIRTVPTTSEHTTRIPCRWASPARSPMYKDPGRDNAAPRILRKRRHHCTRLGLRSIRLSHRSKPACRRISDAQAPVDGGSPEDPFGFRDVPKRTMVEQMQELQAALSLNKSQLARVLRVSRPGPCGWLQDREPDAADAERARILLRCLTQARVTAASPLNARFVRQPADLAGPALLKILEEEPIDEDRVVAAIQQAQALGDSAARRRAAREGRLRSLGFEDPGPEQRREQLARNMALRSWPNP